jgi:hypothetical protein
LAINGGKRRSDEVWAVVDEQGFVAWTRGSNKTTPRIMTYGSEGEAKRNIRHAPEVVGREYSIKRIYHGS